MGYFQRSRRLTQRGRRIKPINLFNSEVTMKFRILVLAGALITVVYPSAFAASKGPI